VKNTAYLSKNFQIWETREAKDVGLGVYRVDRRRGSLRSKEKGTSLFSFFVVYSFLFKVLQAKAIGASADASWRAH